MAAEDASLIIATREPLAVSRPAADTSVDRASTSIVTRLTLDVSPAEAWQVLSFYEQISEPPPFYLRLLLPVPIRIEGKKSKVGDEAICVYEGGQLVKRVTEVNPGHTLAFIVISQNLAVGGAMKLAGGRYTLRELGDGRTEVAVATHYTSPKRPRWLWRPIEAAVCHLFHRHILCAMRRDAEARRLASQEGKSR